jgi:hypothetical protein
MVTAEDMDKLRKQYPSRITRAKAIKLYCKHNCCAGDTNSWKNCTFKGCFLWNFRMGKEMLGNQTSFKKHRAKVGVFEQKQASEQEGQGDE